MFNKLATWVGFWSTLAVLWFVVFAALWMLQIVEFGLAVIFVIVGELLLVPVVLFPQMRQEWESKGKHGFVFEFMKALATPVVLAVLAIVYAHLSERQRDEAADNQKKAEIMRDFVANRNRPDVAFFTAVGTRLSIHLQRYQKVLKDAQAKHLQGEKLEACVKDDEEAAYFFYGMFRVALVDFYANKGYVLYPRIWMEEAFDGLADSVVEKCNGAREQDPDAFPDEEAALYKYFGASKATYHTMSERPSESPPGLFDFYHLLRDPITKDCLNERMKDPYFEPMVMKLRDGCERFRSRLRSCQLKPEEIRLAFEAMVGLDDYAFNTLFSVWYGEPGREKVPVYLNKPVDYSSRPPDKFLPYPWSIFEGTDEQWSDERGEAWKLVVNQVPKKLGGRRAPEAAKTAPKRSAVHASERRSQEKKLKIQVNNPDPRPKLVRVYVAAPLFTQAEWQWNARLAAELRREGCDIILPQEKGIPSKKEKLDPRTLFLANVADIERADLVLAVLDGADPDSGTCWECGYAFKIGRPVIGVRTDFRGGGDDPGSAVNLMLSQSCREMLLIPPASRDDLPRLAKLVVRAIAKQKR